jgi:uncharacterized delta-60 repeat protein
LDASFNPVTGANSSILSIVLQSDGKIMIGGSFTSYNGTSRNYIARLNADGSLDTFFNPAIGANNSVRSIVPQPDGKILIGGDFTTYNATSRNRIARIKSDANLDEFFNPAGIAADNVVNSIILQPNDRILIGGRFISYNGVGRNRIARLVNCNFVSSLTLVSAPGNTNQTLCISTNITPVVYASTGGMSLSATGLPVGVTSSFVNDTLTISGAPIQAGVFNYNIPLTEGCGTISETGTLTVTPNNTITLTSGEGTNNQTVCINTAITNITYSTTGATGATVTGLPAGVTSNFASNTITISGTPTASGTFNYTVTLTGGCAVITATGSITVTLNNTITLTSGTSSDNQAVCINTTITNITYSTTGATGANVSGIPPGVTGSFTSNTVTISGTPTLSGTFNYTVTLTG